VRRLIDLNSSLVASASSEKTITAYGKWKQDKDELSSWSSQATDPSIATPLTDDNETIKRRKGEDLQQTFIRSEPHATLELGNIDYHNDLRSDEEQFRGQSKTLFDELQDSTRLFTILNILQLVQVQNTEILERLRR